MKKVVFLFMLLFSFCGSFAQQNKRAVLHLKDGSVIKGRYISTSDDKVVVRTGGSTVVINNSEIDSLSPGVSSQKPVNVDKNYFIKTSLGLLAGSKNNDDANAFSFDVGFNYKLFNRLYAGIGAGIDFFDVSYMPVFMNLEYHFRKSRLTPLIGLQGGYMFSLDSDERYYNPIQYDYFQTSSMWPYPYNIQPLDNKGGIMVNPYLGFVHHINNNLGWSLSFGYRYHEINREGENDYSMQTKYNRLNIRLGLIFN